MSSNKINPHPGDLSFIDVPGSINTFWLSINNWGEIAGVEGINDAGVIVGEAAFGTHQIGFLYDPRSDHSQLIGFGGFHDPWNMLGGFQHDLWSMLPSHS